MSDEEVFVVDSRILCEAVKTAGYAYAEEYGYDGRAADFNLYLQEELPRFIKKVGKEVRRDE